MSIHSFRQVDVFGAEPLSGNPVAVVHGADWLNDEQMAAFARWTNLSETTYVLTPTDPEADYRLRIFTPGGELPFAGHPTLGSAHAWLESGGVPASEEEIVQECGAGLVHLLRGDRLAFEAPPLLRTGPVDEPKLARVARGLGVPREQILNAHWVDNGPGWLAVMLPDAAAVLEVVPDPAELSDLAVGIFGVYPEGDCAIEVRAFVPGIGVAEDPVTGSLNAGLAQWLAGTTLPRSYVASQGTALQRRGRVYLDVEPNGAVWVGGDTRTTVLGRVRI